VELPPKTDWPKLFADDYDYLHVRASGRFDPGAILVFAGSPAEASPEPGVQVFAPFRLDGGGVIFVNRGFAPQSKAKAQDWPPRDGGPAVVQGVLRAPQTRNSFTPQDDPARNLWFTRDPAKFAASLNVADAAPFTLDEDPGDGPADGLLRVKSDPAAIPNNHLSYAVTWFGLAAALSVMFTFYAWGRLRSR
jgi:surfeit locus 1 family protein